MPGQWTRRLGSCSSQARSISTAPRTSNIRPVTLLSGNELGPTQQDGHRTLRKRLDGKKTLPLPPLLDPVVVESRSRHEQKKEKPKAAEFAPFQRKLWENPFGALLIHPVDTAPTNTVQPTHSPRLFASAARWESGCPATSSPPCTYAHTLPPAHLGWFLYP